VAGHQHGRLPDVRGEHLEPGQIGGQVVGVVGERQFHITEHVSGEQHRPVAEPDRAVPGTVAVVRYELDRLGGPIVAERFFHRAPGGLQPADQADELGRP
jgi:hypothetical protein